MRTSPTTGHRRRRQLGQRATLAALAAAGMLSTAFVPAPPQLPALPTGAGVTAAATSSVIVDRIQPTDGSVTNATTMYAARIAPRTPGAEPGWMVKADFRVDNTAGTEDVVVEHVEISYPGSAIAPHSYTPWSWIKEPDDSFTLAPLTLPPGERSWFQVFDGLDNPAKPDGHASRELTGEIPTRIAIDVTYGDSDTPVHYEYDLRAHRNDTVTGGLLFPTAAADLDPNQYYTYGTRHTVDDGGRPRIRPGMINQRFALDIGLEEVTAGGWTPLSQTGRDKRAQDPNAPLLNEDFLAFGQPVYAMASGTVVSCAKGHTDHPFTGRFPTTEEREAFDKQNGGNQITIDHGDEIVEYDHLKAGSVDALCPGDATFAPVDVSALGIEVLAGQQLGELGNTGNSSGPHMHLEVRRTSADGRPFHFENIRVAGHVNGWRNLPMNPTLGRVDGAMLPTHSIVLPNPCGLVVPEPGFAEHTRHGVPADCVQDVYNLAVNQGYDPTYVDGYEVAGENFFNLVFRSDQPQTIARFGLDRGAFQELFDNLTAAGWKVLHVDAYRSPGGTDLYAPVFVLNDGPSFFAVAHATAEQAEDAIDLALTNGFAPFNASTVFIGGRERHTLVFQRQPNIGTWYVDSLPEAEFQARFDTRTDAGLSLYDIDAWDRDGTPYITAVFVSDLTGGWSARHGQTGPEHEASVHEQVNGAGFLTRAVAGYEVGGEHRYASLSRPMVQTSITSAPSAPTNSADATFAFRASDPFSTFACMLDGGGWTVCSSPRSYADLAEGSHTFAVRATDREVLTDGSPATHGWFVDTIAPEVELTRPAENTMYVRDEPVPNGMNETRIVGDVTVVAHATDAGSGVALVTFFVDGVAVPASEVTHDPVAETWSFVWSPPKAGKQDHTLRVTAVDHATNTASTSRDVVATATGR